MIVDKQIKSAWRQTRLMLGVLGFGIVVLGAGILVTYQFVGPPPPSQIVLATGPDGGAYQLYGARIAAYLAQQGIDVELRETAGAVENLALLGSDSGVDIGFVQGGLVGVTETAGVTALGSLYFEPIWFFAKSDSTIADFSDLTGKRVSIGAEGSGTRVVIMRLLAAIGITTESATFVEFSNDELEDAFAAGEVDAAFLIGGAESSQIASLVDLDDVVLLSPRRADAFSRQLSYLSKVVLPEGVLNLVANKPDTEIETVAVAAMLAAREDLHPALNDLLMIASAQIFGEHTILADAGQFPTAKYTDLPLSKETQRYFERGAPFLMRYLPFWAATLVDRLWVLLFPLIGLSIPLVKLMPPMYHWRIRRRLLKRYTELHGIDPQRKPVTSETDRDARLQLIEILDINSVGIVVPVSYSDDIYKLRRDIDLVRRKIAVAIIPASVDSVSDSSA
jgi:TRAP transporter TAXI family solute receptor